MSCIDSKIKKGKETEYAESTEVSGSEWPQQMPRGMSTNNNKDWCLLCRVWVGSKN